MFRSGSQRKAGSAGKPTTPTDAVTKQTLLSQRAAHLNSKFPHVNHITTSMLTDLKEKGEDVVFVDIRTEKEQDVSILQGALTEKQFEQRLPSILQSKPKVVAYCTIGYRSSKFAEKYAKYDLDVYNMSGALLQACFDDLPLVDSQGQPTRNVHVFSKEYMQYVPESYNGTYFSWPMCSYISDVLGSSFSTS